MSFFKALLIFCSINNHSAESDPKCVNYIVACLDQSQSSYVDCQTQWILNQGRKMGRCFNPDLKVNQCKQSTK